MNDDDPTEDDDLDDPVMWGGAELGKPATRHATPPPARRKGVEASARRDLARRAGDAVQRFGPRPPWPGASKPIPDVLEPDHPPAGALTPDDDLDGES